MVVVHDSLSAAVVAEIGERSKMRERCERERGARWEVGGKWAARSTEGGGLHPARFVAYRNSSVAARLRERPNRVKIGVFILRPCRRIAININAYENE